MPTPTNTRACAAAGTPTASAVTARNPTTLTYRRMTRLHRFDRHNARPAPKNPAPGQRFGNGCDKNRAAFVTFCAASLMGGGMDLFVSHRFVLVPREVLMNRVFGLAGVVCAMALATVAMAQQPGV